MPGFKTWAKMGVTGAILCIGGPALVIYVTPTEEELFNRFSPELKKKNLEMREERIQRHNDFMAKMREYSKSDKPIWVVAAEADAKEREAYMEAQKQAAVEEEKRITEAARKVKDEIKKQSSGV